MSYKGYTQVLCANGHLRQFDAFDDGWSSYESWGGEPKLAEHCSCGAAFVWHYEVDETNCEGEPAELIINQPAESLLCDLGHQHVIKEVTYRIPTKS